MPLSELFPSGEYPTGELLNYAQDMNTARTATTELRYNDRQHLEDPSLLNDYRKAAEVHRQVRKWIRETVKPGQTLSEIAVGIDDGVRALLGNPGIEPGDSLKSGLGFPTGLSLNNVVAHYTPNPGQKDIVLQHQDVMKVDYGVHVNGWIVDSAFTMSFDPTYDNLLAAVKDATNTGIKVSNTHHYLSSNSRSNYTADCRNRRPHLRHQRCHPRDHGKLRGRGGWENIPSETSSWPLRTRHQAVSHSWWKVDPIRQEQRPDKDGRRRNLCHRNVWNHGQW